MIEPDYNTYYSIEQLDRELSSGQQMERIKKVMEMTEGSVLDMGAGLGKLGVLLKNANRPYLLLDIKQNYIDYMNTLGLNTLKADIRHCPEIPDQSWDTVVVADGVEHYHNFGEVLKEACRIARKKVVITICRNSKDAPWHLWDISWESVAGGHWNVIQFHRLKEDGTKK